MLLLATDAQSFDTWLHMLLLATDAHSFNTWLHMLLLATDAHFCRLQMHILSRHLPTLHLLPCYQNCHVKHTTSKDVKSSRDSPQEGPAALVGGMLSCSDWMQAPACIVACMAGVNCLVSVWL
jgi:hypothetical protein